MTEENGKRTRRGVIPFSEHLEKMNLRIQAAEKKLMDLKLERDVMIERHNQRIEQMRAMLPGIIKQEVESA